MPVPSSRGQNFGNIPEKADTTGLQDLLQSFRGREMGKGQKSRSMKEHATGVSEGGDRLSVREHGFHAARLLPATILLQEGIGGSFGAEDGLGAVAGVDFHIVGKR